VLLQRSRETKQHPRLSITIVLGSTNGAVLLPVMRKQRISLSIRAMMKVIVKESAPASIYFNELLGKKKIIIFG